MKFVILSEKEYQEVQQRLFKGEELINQQGGFLIAPEKLVWLFQVLAEASLSYEIENDLLLNL